MGGNKYYSWDVGFVLEGGMVFLKRHTVQWQYQSITLTILPGSYNCFV